MFSQSTRDNIIRKSDNKVLERYHEDSMGKQPANVYSRRYVSSGPIYQQIPVKFEINSFDTPADK